LRSVSPLSITRASDAAAEIIGDYFRSMGQGTRHTNMVALAGTMLNYHPGDAVREIIEAGWEATGDSELQRRAGRGEVARAVEDTLDRMADEDTYTGRPTLDEDAPGLSDELSEALGWSISMADIPLSNGRGRKATDSSDSSDSFPQVFELPEFPVDALPKPWAAFIRAAAKSVNCPPELVAIPSLAAASGAIGLSRQLVIKRRYTETALLWLAAIAGPGQKKTPAQKAAMLPMREIQAELRKKHADAKERWLDEMREHALAVKRARKNDEIDPKAPEKPPLRRTLVDDITIEALAQRLSESPRGLLSEQDELSGFLRGMDQYKAGGKGNARQQYLKIWSSSPITVDRKGEDESIAIPEPYVTIQGGMQPSIITEIADGRDDGFMDRFLFCYPSETSGGYSDYEIPEDVEDDYVDLIKALWGEGEPEVKHIGMESAAKDQFKRESRAMSAESHRPGFPAVLEGAWGKMDSQLARLALILSCARVATKGGSTSVLLEDMENAIKLLSYFKAAARKVWGQIHEFSPDDALASALFTVLTEGGYVYRGTISNLYHKFYGREAKKGGAESLGHAVRRVVKATDALSYSSKSSFQNLHRR
jgi:putative DNA primase/helicase